MTEPNDHLTIEQRLARMEHAVRVHGVQIEVLNGYLSDTINTDSGMDEDILDLAERVAKLEDANEPDDRKIYIGFKQKDKAHD